MGDSTVLEEKEMKLLFITETGQMSLINGDHVPRVGDKVDMFYEPLPTVTSVVWYPSDERMQALSSQADVILTVR